MIIDEVHELLKTKIKDVGYQPYIRDTPTETQIITRDGNKLKTTLNPDYDNYIKKEYGTNDPKVEYKKE